MRPKTNIFLVILLAMAVVLGNAVTGFAENSAADFANDSEGFSSGFDEGYSETTLDLNTPVTDTQTTVDPEAQKAFLDRLKQELNLSKTDYRQTMSNLSDLQARLNMASEEKSSIQSQMRNLEAIATITEDKLANVIKQISAAENGIALLYEEIDAKQTALDYQKNLLKDYINIIYKEENNYFSIDEDGGLNAFKLLLSDGSVGTNLKELKYFDMLNETGQQLLDKLTQLTKDLNEKELDLKRRKAHLSDLYKNLKAESEQLNLQKQSKQNLLNLTQGQQEVYSQLLQQTLREQEQAFSDVKQFSDSVALIEQKMQELGANFNPDDFKNLLDHKAQVFYDFQLKNGQSEISNFIWPVDPDIGLSAYFRDPGYRGVFGVQHNAIDIPIYQGSPIRAAAEGVVYSTKDNNYGYSYIILAHAGGMMTVYGHVSSILVKEGDTVTAGSIIGLSGGMPGTKGAGYMTTGPHVHFEMLKKGLYVDPLTYLPMNVLTKEQVELLPEKYKTIWEKAIENASATLIERLK